MSPFDRGGLVLGLYVATLALHAVFIGYVVAGTAFALVRKDDPIAATVRDRLPFMLGCGITAGVAPLLFLQLLHQTRFYTANLLLGPRWLAVVPVLIAGFYALYVQKMSERWRRPALAVALACFVFVAWSWSELHELMQADPVWRDFYGNGDRLYLTATVPARLVVLLGAMATTFAMVATWSTDDTGRTRLARVALLSRLVSTGGAVWLWQTGFAASGGPARAWVIVLGIAVVVEVVAWAALLRRPTETALTVATAAGTGALVAAVIVREAPRVALIEPTHHLAGDAGGTLVFAVAAIVGTAAIAWVVKTARSV